MTGAIRTAGAAATVCRRAIFFVVAAGLCGCPQEITTALNGTPGADASIDGGVPDSSTGVDIGHSDAGAFDGATTDARPADAGDVGRGQMSSRHCARRPGPDLGEPPLVEQDRQQLPGLRVVQQHAAVAHRESEIDVPIEARRDLHDIRGSADHPPVLDVDVAGRVLEVQQPHRGDVDETP